MQRIEAVRDRIMAMCGTDEPLIEPQGDEAALLIITRQWRKPLRLDEISRLAQTTEVKQRPGRP